LFLLPKEGSNGLVDEHVDDHLRDDPEDRYLCERCAEGDGRSGDGLRDLNGQYDELDDDADLQCQHHTGGQEETKTCGHAAPARRLEILCSGVFGGPSLLKGAEFLALMVRPDTASDGFGIAHRILQNGMPLLSQLARSIHDEECTKAAISPAGSTPFLNRDPAQQAACCAIRPGRDRLGPAFRGMRDDGREEAGGGQGMQRMEIPLWVNYGQAYLMEKEAKPLVIHLDDETVIKAGSAYAYFLTGLTRGSPAWTWRSPRRPRGESRRLWGRRGSES